MGRDSLDFIPAHRPHAGVMLWNSPNCQALRDVVSILLAGNSYVLKHAPNVMGFAYLLARCAQRAGLPAGTFSVLNAVPSRISRAIADTGKVCIADKRIVLERPIAQAITTRELANRSEFGLSCAFWTRNRDLAKSMACQRRPAAYSSQFIRLGYARADRRCEEK